MSIIHEPNGKIGETKALCYNFGLILDGLMYHWLAMTKDVAQKKVCSYIKKVKKIC